MTCECITEMEAALAPSNTKLGITIGFSRDGKSWMLPYIHTEKIVPRLRKGPVLAIPTFCPFCGTKYGDEA